MNNIYTPTYIYLQNISIIDLSMSHPIPSIPSPKSAPGTHDDPIQLHLGRLESTTRPTDTTDMGP